MFILAGFGGMVGAYARFQLGAWLNRKSKNMAPFPVGTWCINWSGSFLLGLLVHWHTAGVLHESLWLLLGIGFCGAYTTFSTFGTETLQLMQTKHYLLAIWYVVLSVLSGLLFAWVGYHLLSWL